MKGRNIDDETMSGPLYQAAVDDGDYACTTTLTLAMDLTTFDEVMSYSYIGILYQAEFEDNMQIAKFLKGKEIFYKDH